MRIIHTGLSLFASEALRQAALPLFAAGEVGALEWSFDPGWSRPEPEWVSALLDAYAEEGRLYGHGVHFSPTSVRPDATGWLARLAKETERRAYQQVTEHWGFSRAGGLLRGAPLPLPACEASVAQAVRALGELREAVRAPQSIAQAVRTLGELRDATRGRASAIEIPIGIENLALAFSEEDVEAQPVMLARVLDEVDGVLLLDVHNLWCQAVNYGRDARELATRYPLARVRQLHLAGGGWSSSAFGAPFRRDTHDALIPDEVLELVAWLIPRCPTLEVVLVERLPETLRATDAQERWRAQWREVAALVERAAAVPLVPQGERKAGEPGAGEPGAGEPGAGEPGAGERMPQGERVTCERGTLGEREAATLNNLSAISDVSALGRYQDALVEILRAAASPAGARLAHAALLDHPDVAPFRDQVQRFDLRALEVACALTARWGVPNSNEG
jgi:uncharacterized protein